MTGTARCSPSTTGAWAPGARTSTTTSSRRYGYEKEAEEIQDAYLGGDRKRAAALVPAELVAGMSLVGDAGYVKDRIAAYRESGVTVLNVQPVGPNGLKDIETIAGWVA